jgi:hypothetical protein
MYLVVLIIVKFYLFVQVQIDVVLRHWVRTMLVTRKKEYTDILSYRTSLKSSREQTFLRLKREAFLYYNSTLLSAYLDLTPRFS